jgi:hypothetical protein
MLLAALVAGCGADSGDFRASAERFIEGERMASESGTTFTDAVCQEPSSTDVGTTFRCTAVDAQGAEWTFEVSIVDDSNFQITGRHTG